MNEVEYKQMKEALKKVIKTKGLKYADIAKRLDVSEVTVKRFFSNSDESYSGKIFEICEALEIPFFTLVELAKDTRKKHFDLTKEQDLFFSKNLGYFAIFREIYRKNPVKDIKKRWKLNNQQMFKVLMKLEKLGLIEVHENDKVKIVPEGVLELGRNTKLEILLRKELTTPFLEMFKAEYNAEEDYYHNSEIEMGVDTRKAMYDELRELTLKYCSLALRDKNLLPTEKLTSVRWLMCFAEYQTKWEKFKPL